MGYTNELFDFMMSAFKGLDYDCSLTKKDYILMMLKKILGMIVITGCLLGIVSLLFILINPKSQDATLTILFTYFVLLYIVSSIPSLIDTLRTYRIHQDVFYRRMVIVYLVLIVISGILLHFGGTETLSGLLDL